MVSKVYIAVKILFRSDPARHVHEIKSRLIPCSANPQLLQLILSKLPHLWKPATPKDKDNGNLKPHPHNQDESNRFLSITIRPAVRYSTEHTARNMRAPAAAPRTRAADGNVREELSASSKPTGT